MLQASAGSSAKPCWRMKLVMTGLGAADGARDLGNAIVLSWPTGTLRPSPRYGQEQTSIATNARVTRSETGHMRDQRRRYGSAAPSAASRARGPAKSFQFSKMFQT